MAADPRQFQGPPPGYLDVDDEEGAREWDRNNDGYLSPDEQNARRDTNTARALQSRTQERNQGERDDRQRRLDENQAAYERELERLNEIDRIKAEAQDSVRQYDINGDGIINNDERERITDPAERERVDGLSSTLLGDSAASRQQLYERRRRELDEEVRARQAMDRRTRANQEEADRRSERARFQDAMNDPARAHQAIDEYYDMVERGDKNADNFARDMNLIPILGGLTGAGSALAMSQEQRLIARRRAHANIQDRLAPRPDQLAVDYEAGAYAEGPDRSEAANAYAEDWTRDGQQQSFRDLNAQIAALNGIANQGGLTSADRDRMRMAQMQSAQAMRGQRDADLSALEARGMGNSGAAIASRLAAQQYGANAMSMAGAQTNIAAQQRADQARMAALQAMQQGVSQYGAARGQSYDEASQRGTAADRYNQWDTTRRQNYNNQLADANNRTSESRANALQMSFNNGQQTNNQRDGQAAQSQDIPFKIAQMQKEEREETSRGIGTTLGAIAAFL